MPRFRHLWSALVIRFSAEFLFSSDLTVGLIQVHRVSWYGNWYKSHRSIHSPFTVSQAVWSICDACEWSFVSQVSCHGKACRSYALTKSLKNIINLYCVVRFTQWEGNWQVHGSVTSAPMITKEQVCQDETASGAGESLLTSGNK